MRILITGSRGQLGNELRRCLEGGRSEIAVIPSCYEEAVVDYVDYSLLDISDAAAVDAWFAEHGPYDLVVNCAAVTNVDGCESDEEGAYRVNALGAENMAKAARACGAKIVHVSTDYVFPGTDPEPRCEDDPTGPISAYGRTKLAGEQLVQAACPCSFIVRTAWLYGYVGRNFVKTMMRLAREHGAISVVGDQYGNPTSANDLAHEILAIAATENYGVYHCTNEGTCSWFDFASAVVDGAGILCEKESLTSAEYKARFPQSADRPAYSSLRNKRLEDTIGNDMRPWRDALATYLDNLDELGD
ncbi:MAG: dTDP-4-dehydrorhamnose reductase [Coriobacteriaceae bacterium]|nr:dTDP-4-dehydrorhamnose reductase [Coriobacteriaceae bacterium]